VLGSSDIDVQFWSWKLTLELSGGEAVRLDEMLDSSMLPNG
jgi:hypothetical protein